MALKQIDKLNILDFSPGIRAEYINENFDLLRRWIEAERLRLGGWGLVEGFDLSKDLSDFSISITEGVMINSSGQEIKVDGHYFKVGPPVYKTMVEEVVVQAEGVLTLQFPLYSNKEKHTIIYDPPQYNILHDDEVKIIDIETNSNITIKDIRFIDENIVILNSKFEGVKVRIEYLYVNDRIDGIFLKNDGSEYIYEIGIISTSPSQQVVQDYLNNGYYLIGFAYWHIGKEIDVDFITSDRTLRPIYVDKNGILYLNGKPYEGSKFIYFIKPEYPEENTLWFDVESEILYIWRPNENGKYEWKPVNDLSRFSREHSVFTPDQNPEDLQTFDFSEKANLRFVPGHNQLTIIVDQVVIMSDQYEELIDESIYDTDVCTGYGFKLKYPLERASTVEVYVDRNVNTKAKALELFPHVTAFIDSRIYLLDQDHAANSVWECAGEYEIGNYQLEIWVNGLKLNIGIDFQEALKDGTHASIEDYGTLSNKFIINKALKNRDVVNYKITRQMATYDNFRLVTDNLNASVDEALESMKAAEIKLDNTVNNVTDALDVIEKSVEELDKNVTDLKSDTIKKSEGVAVSNLSAEIKAALFKKANYIIQNASVSLINIKNIKETDFFSVYWIDDITRLILIKDTDYTVSGTEEGIIISIDPQWMSDTAQIYIEAITLGV